MRFRLLIIIPAILMIAGCINFVGQVEGPTSIKGQVVDLDGRSVPDALVSYEYSQIRNVYSDFVLTDENGFFEFSSFSGRSSFPPGEYVFTVSFDLFENMKKVEIYKDTDPIQLSLPMKGTIISKGSLSGYITNLDNNPVEGAIVHEKYRDATTYSDENGYYSINELVVGEAILIVSKSGYNITGESFIQTNLPIIMNFTLGHPKSGPGSINGFIYDESGNKLPEVNVYGLIAGEIISTTSKSDGRYEFNNVIPGNYRLLAIKEGYSGKSDFIEVSHGMESNMDFELPDGSSNIFIAGFVTKSNSYPLDAAKVSFEQPGSLSRTSVDGSGYYSNNIIVSQYSGSLTYTVSVSAPGYNEIKDSITISRGNYVIKNYIMENLIPRQSPFS